MILLSLVTAAVYGSGDFCGGLAAKRTSVIRVVTGSHLVGLIGVGAIAPFLAERAQPRDLILGAIGGAFGGLAIGLLYRRLAVGPMHVVAPLTAITSALVPTAWGVAIGERLSIPVWIGITCGLLAIGLISSSSAATHAPVTLQVVGESLLAGCGFGAFFILLDATESVSAPWPVVTSRVLTTVCLISFLSFKRQPIFERDGVTLGLVAATGVFDVAANLGFLYATQRGNVAVVSLLTSLYPLSTVALARIILGERMTSLQGWGVVVALGATGLIAAG